MVFELYPLVEGAGGGQEVVSKYKNLFFDLLAIATTPRKAKR